MNLFARYIHRWEHRLHDTERKGQPPRVFRSFEWGAEWVGGKPGEPAPLVDPAGSDTLFAYERPADYSLKGDILTFTSPLVTPYPENNTVHARWFPAKRPTGRAVVVIPQWNSDERGHVGLCRLLNFFGIDRKSVV